MFSTHLSPHHLFLFFSDIIVSYPTATTTVTPESNSLGVLPGNLINQSYFQQILCVSLCIYQLNCRILYAAYISQGRVSLHWLTVQLYHAFFSFSGALHQFAKATPHSTRIAHSHTVLAIIRFVSTAFRQEQEQTSLVETEPPLQLESLKRHSFYLAVSHSCHVCLCVRKKTSTKFNVIDAANAALQLEEDRSQLRLPGPQVFRIFSV